MQFQPGEVEAIKTVLKAGAQYGYGNLIGWLITAWSRLLTEKHKLPRANQNGRQVDGYPDEFLDMLDNPDVFLNEHIRLND